jgi:26S proteasome non-ATPase regulatory subunit 9
MHSHTLSRLATTLFHDHDKRTAFISSEIAQRLSYIYIFLLAVSTMPPATSATAPTPARERALALMAERDVVDQQLQAHTSTLSSQGANMSTVLVDGQGFPRADMDIVAVRTARVRVIELRNDRARLTDEIAQALADVHSSAASQPVSDVKINGIDGVAGQSPAGTPDVTEPHPQILAPFARVDGVAPGSPAQQAVSELNLRLAIPILSDLLGIFQGLQREDLILAFGDLTTQSFSNSSLQPLAQLVASHANVSTNDRQILILG